MMENLWDSTVAFTAYNLFAVTGSSATFDDVVTGVQNVHGPEGVEPDQVRRALAVMLHRGWIDFDKAGRTYSLRDQQRRIVKWRERTNQGWDGWQADGGPSVGQIPIEQVTQ